MIACAVSILQVSHTECCNNIYAYQGTLAVWYSWQSQRHLDFFFRRNIPSLHQMFLLTVVLSFTKSFYVQFSLQSGRISAQVLQNSARTCLQRQESYSQPGFSLGRNIMTTVVSPIKALFKGYLRFLERIIKIKTMLAETVKAKY